MHFGENITDNVIKTENSQENILVTTVKSEAITEIDQKEYYDIYEENTDDWIYEEEILQSSRAYYWSKDGEILAYMKFNDEKVTKFPITQENVDRIFTSGPEMINYINYPRPGEDNPTVSLHYVRLKDLNSQLAMSKRATNDNLENEIYFQDQITSLHKPNGKSDYLIQRIEWNQGITQLIIIIMTNLFRFINFCDNFESIQ